MSALRNLALAGLLLAAVVLQVAVASQVAILGVVPDLCLMVVVAAGLARGREVGAVTGFLGGLGLDLAPPADHVAGRWALAFAVAGYLVGLLVDRLEGSERVRLDPGSRVTAGVVVAGASLVATVVFLLAGLLVHDRAASFGETVGVLAVSVVLDAVVAVLVLPPLVRLVTRLQPARLQAGAGPGRAAREPVTSGW